MIMFRRFGILVVLASLRIAASFVTFPISGEIGCAGVKYRVNEVTQGVAHQYVKGALINSIERNDERFVVDELNKVREACGSALNKETFVAFINEKGYDTPDYVILYRKTCHTPTVYTIDSMLVTSEKKVEMSMDVVEKALRKFCDEHRGYLQLYPLKRWSSGRYMKAISLEKSVKSVNN